MTAFAILDRDGTINEEKRYLSRPDEVQLLPGAAEGLSLMQDLGLGLIIVTNQSGLARGYFNAGRLEAIHERLFSLLEDAGVHIDGVYVCPHHPGEKCRCRKPNPGLVERAAADFNFNPQNAFVIGDNRCDVALGETIGATTILVRTGYGKEIEREGNILPDLVEDNLIAAAAAIERMLGRETREVIDAER
jgi:D-glycero-D-manno-heptose 1,7-bisphosphate phosphatase